MKVKIWVDINVNLKFIPYKMWQPSKPTTKEDDELFIFTYMAEALDKVHKSPIFANLKTIKELFKTVYIDPEPKGCS